MNTKDAERCKTTAAHSHSTLGDSDGVFKMADGDYGCCVKTSASYARESSCKCFIIESLHLCRCSPEK